jgi:hypothetical protein
LFIPAVFKIGIDIGKAVIVAGEDSNSNVLINGCASGRDL